METKDIISIEELDNHYNIASIFLQMFNDNDITGKELYNIFQGRLKKYIRDNFRFGIHDFLHVIKRKDYVQISSKIKHALFTFHFYDYYRFKEHRWFAIFEMIMFKKKLIKYYFENYTDISDTISMKLLFNTYAYYEELCNSFTFRSLQSSFNETLLRQRFNDFYNVDEIIAAHYQDIFLKPCTHFVEIKLNEEKDKLTYHPNYNQNFNKDIPLKKYEIKLFNLNELDSTTEYLNRIRNQINPLIYKVIKDFVNVDDVFSKMFELSKENNNKIIDYAML